MKKEEKNQFWSKKDAENIFIFDPSGDFVSKREHNKNYIRKPKKTKNEIK